MDLVCCLQCLLFVPDPVGDGNGIGKCTPFEEYKAKNPSKQNLRDALRKLGNDPDRDGDLFWGGPEVDRRCEKYQDKTNVVQFKRAS